MLIKERPQDVLARPVHPALAQEAVRHLPDFSGQRGEPIPGLVPQIADGLEPPGEQPARDPITVRIFHLYIRWLIVVSFTVW